MIKKRYKFVDIIISINEHKKEINKTGASLSVIFLILIYIFTEIVSINNVDFKISS